jgi:hypothetical protein
MRRLVGMGEDRYRTVNGKCVFYYRILTCGLMVRAGTEE